MMNTLMSRPKKSTRLTSLTQRTNSNNINKILNNIEKINNFTQEAQSYLDKVITNYTRYANIHSHKKVLLYASILSSQKYGPYLQKFYFAHWNINTDNIIGGDGTTSNGNNIEFKVSYRKSENQNYNLVQIRLNDNVDYFVYLLIDMINPGKINPQFVVLNDEQMRYEVSMLGNYAHGNAITNRNHNYTEYRISLNEEQAVRWIEEYGVGNSIKNIGNIID